MVLLALHRLHATRARRAVNTLVKEGAAVAQHNASLTMTIENAEKPTSTDTAQAQGAGGTTPPPEAKAQEGNGAQQGAPANNAQPASPPAQQEQRGGRYVPDAEFKRIKDESARKGRAALAKKYGFASVDELDAFLAANAKKNNAQPTNNTPPAAKGKDATPAKTNAGKAESTEEGGEDDTLGAAPTHGGDSGNSRQDKTAELAQRAAKAERKAALAMRDLKAERMQHALEKEAWRAGVQDTDYAIHLFKRHLSSLSEEEAVKVDPAAYFTELKTTHPYVFGTATIPATTTSNPNEAAPESNTAAAPAKGKAAAATPTPPQKKPEVPPAKNAMQMSAEEYAQWKASRGLDANALSSIPQKRSH